MTMTRPTTEQITHNGQILKDVLGPVANVLAYGAKGDGATNDLPAIAAALDAVKAAGGGTVYIPRTANGYYISNTGIAYLQNASNVAILSDGATLKLQARANFSSGSDYVFVLSDVSNIRISGLRFEAASLVNRYNNGDASYDSEVNAGRALSTAQTTFRYGFAILYTCSNIDISNCYFGLGIYSAFQIKQPPVSLGIKNVRITDMHFDGVNTQCIYVDEVDGLIVSNIRATNISDDRFAHLFYIQSGTANAVFSNISVDGYNGIPFDFGFAGTNVTVSNVYVANAAVVPSGGLRSAFYFGSACNQMAISNVVAKSIGKLFEFVGGTNISISNVVASQCTELAFVGDNVVQVMTNVTVDGFEFVDGSGIRAIRPGGTCNNVIFRNGLIKNGSAGINDPIISTLNTAAVRTVTFENIRIVYTNFVATNNPIDLRGSATVINVRGCDFVSEFATWTTQSAIYTVGGAQVFVSDCRTWNFALANNANLIYVTSEARCRVEQLPTLLTTLTANSATPSVADFKLFTTANSSATAITNFTGGQQGQEICVVVDDANTTFDFTGTNLKGNNGVDYTATSGDVLFARRIGANWYCTICEA